MTLLSDSCPKAPRNGIINFLHRSELRVRIVMGFTPPRHRQSLDGPDVMKGSSMLRMTPKRLTLCRVHLSHFDIIHEARRIDKACKMTRRM